MTRRPNAGLAAPEPDNRAQPAPKRDRAVEAPMPPLSFVFRVHQWYSVAIAAQKGP